MPKIFIISPNFWFFPFIKQQKPEIFSLGIKKQAWNTFNRLITFGICTSDF